MSSISEQLEVGGPLEPKTKRKYQGEDFRSFVNLLSASRGTELVEEQQHGVGPSSHQYWAEGKT